jgi:hypothetical protein
MFCHYKTIGAIVYIPASFCGKILELISKMVSDKNNNASQMNESEVILKKSIVANQNAAVVL